MSEVTPISAQEQDATLAAGIDAARQAQVEATGRAPWKAGFAGSSDERIGGTDLTHHVGALEAWDAAPGVSVNTKLRAEQHEQKEIGATVAMQAPDGGAIHFASRVRDYDHMGQPRDKTRVTHVNTEGVVTQESISQNPLLARQVGIVAAQRVERGFKDPDAEKARLDRTPRFE